MNLKYLIFNEKEKVYRIIHAEDVMQAQRMYIEMYGQSGDVVARERPNGIIDVYNKDTPQSAIDMLFPVKVKKKPFWKFW